MFKNKTANLLLESQSLLIWQFGIICIALHTNVGLPDDVAAP